jgi:hypothetical protein
MPKSTPSERFAEALNKLQAAGFEVAREGNIARLKKDNCGTALELAADGGVLFREGPGYVVGGEIARLEDRGFQKYLVSSRFSLPALAEHLRAVHHFTEQMKGALGIPSLYNEALGTVSNRYLYDRVHGRDPHEQHVNKGLAPH